MGRSRGSADFSEREIGYIMARYRTRLENGTGKPTNVDIANDIGRKFNEVRTAAGVSRRIRQAERDGHWWRSKRTGRRLTKPQLTKRIVRIAKKHPLFKASVISDRLFSETNHRLSAKTITRRLKHHGLYRCTVCLKTPLREKNRIWRLGYAERFRGVPIEQWERTIVIDEKTYYGKFTGARRIWRRKGQRYLPKNVQKKTAMVQKVKAHVIGALCAKGPLPLLQNTKSTIDGLEMIERMNKIVDAAIDLFDGEMFYILHDNLPSFKKGVMAEFIATREARGIFKVIEFPSQSPDINWIENWWPVVNTRTKERKPASDEELFGVLAREWKKLKPAELLKCAHSMPKRLQAVADNAGYWTGY